jgi:hypothetical protein
MACYCWKHCANMFHLLCFSFVTYSVLILCFFVFVRTTRTLWWFPHQWVNSSWVYCVGMSLLCLSRCSPVLRGSSLLHIASIYVFLVGLCSKSHVSYRFFLAFSVCSFQNSVPYPLAFRSRNIFSNFLLCLFLFLLFFLFYSLLFSLFVFLSLFFSVFISISGAFQRFLSP